MTSPPPSSRRRSTRRRLLASAPSVAALTRTPPKRLTSIVCVVDAAEANNDSVNEALTSARSANRLAISCRASVWAPYRELPNHTRTPAINKAAAHSISPTLRRVSTPRPPGAPHRPGHTVICTEPYCCSAARPAPSNRTTDSPHTRAARRRAPRSLRSRSCCNRFQRAYVPRAVSDGPARAQGREGENRASGRRPIGTRGKSTSTLEHTPCTASECCWLRDRPYPPAWVNSP